MIVTPIKHGCDLQLSRMLHISIVYRTEPCHTEKGSWFLCFQEDELSDGKMANFYEPLNAGEFVTHGHSCELVYAKIRY